MSTIGFIGQGWIGKHLADNFEERGHATVRYAKEAPYDANLGGLKTAEVVFIAVPTPTTEGGFDDSIVASALGHLVPGQIAIIKSTIIPGTTDRLSKLFPHIYVFHAPEFLREATVKRDIAEPERNIIGVPSAHMDDPTWRKKAEHVMSLLVRAPYEEICTATEAEITKYGGNNFLYAKVVFMNMLYDLSAHHGARWDVIARNMSADERIGTSHMQPVHQLAHMDKKAGRGAGGHCFIKDFAALRHHYESVVPEDKETIALLRAFEAKNNHLLVTSGKDKALLEGVYGESVLCVCKISDKKTVCVCGVGGK
jgi:UDP-glucose 6-dehydrogenase